MYSVSSQHVGCFTVATCFKMLFFGALSLASCFLQFATSSRTKTTLCAALQASQYEPPSQRISWTSTGRRSTDYSARSRQVRCPGSSIHLEKFTSFHGNFTSIWEQWEGILPGIKSQKNAAAKKALFFGKFTAEMSGTFSRLSRASAPSNLCACKN